MKRLTKAQVLTLHRELIRQTGGSDGLLDEGLLDSALSAPFHSFDGTDAFPSIQQKGARLGYGLILNGIELDYTQEELSDMVLAMASGVLSFDAMVKWIVEHQI